MSYDDELIAKANAKNRTYNRDTKPRQADYNETPTPGTAEDNRASAIKSCRAFGKFFFVLMVLQIVGGIIMTAAGFGSLMPEIGGIGLGIIFISPITGAIGAALKALAALIEK